MDFIRVLRESFRLLQKRPVLFIPKLATSAVWSVFWLYLLEGLTHPATLSIKKIQLSGLFILIMTPIHVWVFNAYVHIVKQYHQGTTSLREAFRDGFYRLPRGLGAVAITLLLVFLAGLPGGILAAMGYVQGNTALILLGGSLFLLLTLAATTAFYLSPASVIMGEESFMEDFRHGFSASTTNIREVGAITLFSFLLLLAAILVEGTLETVGLIGFFLGRGLGAIVSVYLVIVNPQMLVNAET